MTTRDSQVLSLRYQTCLTAFHTRPGSPAIAAIAKLEMPPCASENYERALEG